MNIFVIGAGGYLGGHLTRNFVAAGHDVTGLVRNEGAAAKVAEVGARPVTGDLTDLSTVFPAVDAADATVYAAQLLLDAEQETVGKLLDHLAGTGKTFVQTSGTGVLSQRTDGDWSEDTFTEDEPFVPSKYIGARRETEVLVESATERGIRSFVMRPPLIWGHGGCPTIVAIARSVRTTGAACYVGRGLNLYSGVHVDDLAEAYRLVIEGGTPGSVYHAVSGEQNFGTIARSLAAELGVQTRSVDVGEAREIWGPALAIINLSVCSRSRSPKIRAELGWAPDPGRTDILDETRHPALLAHAR